jgi:hypothetical protein
MTDHIDDVSRIERLIRTGRFDSVLEKLGYARLGATGNFPQGKVRPDDEGELAVAISTEGDMVFLNFGKPVHWVSLPKHDVIELAKVLLAKAGARVVVEL